MIKCLYNIFRVVIVCYLARKRFRQLMYIQGLFIIIFVVVNGKRNIYTFVQQAM